MDEIKNPLPVINPEDELPPEMLDEIDNAKGGGDDE